MVRGQGDKLTMTFFLLSWMCQEVRLQQQEPSDVRLLHTWNVITLVALMLLVKMGEHYRGLPTTYPPVET